MPYIKGTWSSPITIVGTMKINQTDEALQDIVSDDADSLVNFVNAEFTKIEAAIYYTPAKELASMDIADMTYTDGNLSRIDYEGTNNYEILTYNVATLTNIAHYINNILMGNTVLAYIGAELNSVTYTDV